MPPVMPSVQDLYNLQTDLADFAEFLNTPDVKDITTRLGKVMPSLKKIVDEVRRSNSAYSFTTLAALQAAGTPKDISGDDDSVVDIMCRVWNDPVVANNGLYGWGTNQWVLSQYDPIGAANAAVADINAVLNALPNTIETNLESAGFLRSVGGLDVTTNPGIVTPEDDIRHAMVDDNYLAALLITAMGEVLLPLARAGTLNAQSLTAAAGSFTQLTSTGDLSLGTGVVMTEAGVSNYDIVYVDDNDNPGFGIYQGQVVKPLINTEPYEVGNYNYDYAVADEQDNVIFGYKDGELLPVSGTGDGALSLRDASNINKAQAYASVVQHAFAGNEARYNAVVITGQSLSTGAEGWPHLSRTQTLGNLQIGTDCRQRSYSVDTYEVAGDKVFTPLVANTPNGSALLTDSEINALSPGDGTKGEHVGPGMLNMSKSLFNRHFNVMDTTHQFVCVSVGQGGRNISELSKDNPTNTDTDSIDRYNWYLGALSAIDSAAGAESWQVGAIVFMQGEDDYVSDNPPDDGPLPNKASYLAKLTTYKADLVADALATSEQSAEPLFILYQTGGNYTRDLDEFDNPGLHIGMAQLALTDSDPGVIMAGPVYPYSDKGGHLDANGYRWFGQKLGQVHHHCVTLGKQWMPLRPIAITQIDDTTIDIDFHVPAPPLQFQPVYVGDSNEGSALTLYDARGFTLSDDNGGVAVVNAELVGQTIVRLTAARALAGNPYVWYADRATHGGNGNLCDSDKTQSYDAYEYRPEWGMYASANRAEFVNKPYPLNNWCVAFYLPVGYQLNDY